MATYEITCRVCGAVYDLPDGGSHSPCPACGTENSRPQEEHAVGDVLRRATQQRLRCDFVHAESSYQYVLRDSPDEHEALWGLVQCRYAIQYVKDPRTGKPMPIVHAVQRQPMLTDPDFQEACELAPEAVREQYRREAEYIDDAMEKILALAEKGAPFDVFLCHKTTRTDGQEGYTEDYNRAVQLYMKLDRAGYRVFFAPFAGLNPGEDYEAGIYHALSAAKVMLVVCSNADYINSPWVRTEWQRFLRMSYENGADKHLIPLLYDSFPPRRLPDDFRRLQAISMGELDAAETLMAAVAKFVGKGEESAPAPAPVAVKPEPVAAPQPAADAQITDVSEYMAALMKQLGQTPSPVPQATPAAPAPAPRPAVKPVPEYAPESDFTTGAEEGGVCISGYKGKGGKIAIPPTIGGKQVVSISAFAFRDNMALTGVIIPEGVAKINNYAFYQCGNLAEVELPPSVTEIGESAFSGCSGLKRVNFSEGLISIGFSAFYKCSALAEVHLPTSLSSIGALAFEDCTMLREISIPSGITMLDSKTFDGCSRLETVHLPAGLTEIKNNVFSGCARLKEITIPYGVMRIEDQLFDGCTGLERVTLPSTVEEIGSHAFNECSSLTEVVIPEYVTIIGTEAFASCTRLRRVQLPQRLKKIGDYAFYECAALVDINVPEDIEDIGENAFDGCTSLAAPILTPVRYFGAYRDRDGLEIHTYTGPRTDICIPAYIDGVPVVGIGERVFEKNKVCAVHIPETVRYIEGNPFFADSGEISVAEDNPYFFVRDNALYSREGDLISCFWDENAYDIEVFTIPYGIKRIRENACHGVFNNLREVRIPDTVTHIGELAFGYNLELQRVAIPASVVEIGERAFEGCKRLSELTLPQPLPVIKANAFLGCGLPAGVRMKLAFARKK